MRCWFEPLILRLGPCDFRDLAPKSALRWSEGGRQLCIPRLAVPRLTPMTRTRLSIEMDKVKSVIETTLRPYLEAPTFGEFLLPPELGTMIKGIRASLNGLRRRPPTPRQRRADHGEMRLQVPAVGRCSCKVTAYYPWASTAPGKRRRRRVAAGESAAATDGLPSLRPAP